MSENKDSSIPSVPLEAGDKQWTRLSRRAFLASLGLTAGLFLWPDIIYQGAPIAAREVIRNPLLLNTFLGTAATAMNVFALNDKREPDSPKVTENRSYQPMLSIIERATKSYIQKGGVVNYQRLPFWRNNSFYSDKIIRAMEQDKKDRANIVSRGGKTSIYNVMVTLAGIGDHVWEMIEETTTETGGRYFTSNQVWQNDIADDHNKDKKLSLPTVLEGSGLYDEIVRRVGEDNKTAIPPMLDYNDTDRQLVTVVKGYFDVLESFTEMMVQKNSDQPVSASVILQFLLDKNNGSLDKSLVDIALFLQYEARGKQPLDATVEKWMVLNILDEYSKVMNYSILSDKQYPYRGSLSAKMMTPDRDQDLSRINQIGKPYHVWSLVSKLVGFPSILMKLGPIHQDILDFPEQGPVKTAADLQVAAETDDIDKFLTKFQKQN